MMFDNGLYVISICSLLYFYFLLLFNSVGLFLISVLQYCLAYHRFNRKRVLLSSQGTFSVFCIEPWFSCCSYTRYSYLKLLDVYIFGHLLLLTYDIWKWCFTEVVLGHQMDHQTWKNPFIFIYLLACRWMLSLLVLRCATCCLVLSVSIEW